MATVRPFRGITYEPTRVADLGRVTCPPYDVISDADRTGLYDRHPYNIVRIVSGRDEAGDDATRNKYTRAAEFFRSWVWEGVLRQDDEPALYVYRQAFTDPNRTFRRVWGLLATISLDDEILAHEQTMSGPKADRLALMESVAANLSPIYALYNEPGSSVAAELETWTHDAPVADFVDDDRTRHTAWAVHDRGFHERVAKTLAGCQLHIADGHHRFETAKLYRERRRAIDGVGPWDNIMALLVDARAQPVCILPYHRLVVGEPASPPLDVLERGFDVSALGPVTPDDAVNLGLQLWDEQRPGVFIAFVDGSAYRLVARDVGPDEIPAGILRSRALEPLGASGAERHLAFTPRAAEVASEVAAGRAACGFLMQPVTVERVWELATKGAKMPEKSTYFHPKPRDGIVIRPM